MYKISLLILLCFFSLTSLSQEITIEKIWKNYEFYPKYAPSINALSDGVSCVLRTNDNAIIKYKIADMDKEKAPENIEIIFTPPEGFEYGSFEFNADESKILFLTNVSSKYRYSYTAEYYLYDRETKKLEPLDSEHQPQTLAEYSPDGMYVSYIHKNNLYIKDLSGNKVKQLTYDGKKNKIINGTSDWVYEEEFAITKAYDWSPDSKYIAFLKFNEKNVKQFRMTYYNDLYPDSYKFKYPKAGEDNSVVSAHIIDLKKKCKINSIELGEYEYIPRIKWSEKENKLILQTMNRHQNSLKYNLIDCSNGISKSKVIYEEISDTYIDVDDNLIFLNDGESLLRTSEKDGYNHIYRLNFSGEQEKITNGEWDVIEFLGLDKESNTIYYSSCEPHSTQKSIYAINVDGSGKKELTKEKGYNDAEFLNGMKYFIHTYSNANTPPKISLNKSDGTVVTELEDNWALSDKLKEYPKLSKKVFSSMDLGYVELNTQMILPHDFDSTKKYPVYFNVYGGPGHNEVLDAYDAGDYMYHQLLAQEGYIVFTIDPRGTMYRGAKFKKSTYLELGKLEVEDIINAAIKLGDLPWVDSKRIGIMGWSYGGFMASLAITKGSDVFKTAIAVAPVTNWRYYDNIYTERFMRTPQENQSGYDDNSPINHVDKLKGNYLLIHGAADDNVHYQNTMEMVNAMVDANKQFDLFIYPNKNHGIYGGNTRNHLFQMMFDYIKENL
ncbi:MAG: S9 family peptidase [Crocinitomicaceae bacterium]